jgi:hypothetical protein
LEKQLYQVLSQHQCMPERVVVGPGDLALQLGQVGEQHISQDFGLIVGQGELHKINEPPFYDVFAETW